ncbi:MAG: 4-hydroxy-tetrahydrodipicolinate reductase [Vulcanimicrobiaceae bacterium]
MSAALLRIGVAGALGKLGRAACSAIASAPDLSLVAGFVRDATRRDGALALYDDLGAFYAAGMDVVIDCTVYPISIDVVREAIDAGVSPVIGATGWTDEDIVSVADRCDETGVGALLVPNFSLGAVLMMRFAAEAARVMPHVEIVELHHDGKRDMPSGTAKLTAQRIRESAGLENVPIHSVRLPGLVAHQETIFGGTGETLTIRHDSLSRESFAAGIVLAARNVRSLHDLETGLDALMFPKETV